MSGPAARGSPSPATGRCRRLRLAVALAALAIVGAMPALGHAASSQSPRCLDTAARPAPPRAIAMARSAIAEHALFGGQALDAEGRMVRAGASEAEDAFPGRRRVFAPAPWERVLGYWQSLDDVGGRATGLPDLVRTGALRPASRRLLRQALDQATTPHLRGLGAGPGQGLDSSELRAIGTALDRAAVMDTPWSAAFVGWVARAASLGADEFEFSEAHADYAGAAWQATAAEAAGRPVRSALRVCDIVATPPRAGDLVCQTRGAGAALADFDALGRVLADRPTGGEPVPMHCDIVTAVDATGFDAVGGNVLQSVTLRRLAFAPDTRRLDPGYLASGCTIGAEGCVDRHLSRQPWSLLLQWR